MGHTVGAPLLAITCQLIDLLDSRGLAFDALNKAVLNDLKTCAGNVEFQDVTLARAFDVVFRPRFDGWLVAADQFLAPGGLGAWVVQAMEALPGPSTVTAIEGVLLLADGEAQPALMTVSWG